MKTVDKVLMTLFFGSVFLMSAGIACDSVRTAWSSVPTLFFSGVFLFIRYEGEHMDGE